MKKLQFYLSGFLAVQLVLAAGLLWRDQRQQDMQQQREVLLAVDRNQLQHLEISAGNKTVVLQKNGSQWQLPDLQGLPVDSAKLDALLEKLAGLQSGWPVASSRAARDRFEVAEDKFQKRLRLFTGEGEPAAELFIGSSPGFRKTHVRGADDDAIYAVELNSYELPAEADSWLDKKLLAAGEVQAIAGPDYKLAERDGKWQFAEGGAKLDESKARQLANALANLRITRAATEVPEAEAIHIQVTTDSGELDYEFIQADEHYFVRRGDREQLFELSRYDYERIADPRNQALVLEEKGEVEQTVEEKGEGDSAANS